MIFQIFSRNTNQFSEGPPLEKAPQELLGSSSPKWRPERAPRELLRSSSQKRRPGKHSGGAPEELLWKMLLRIRTCSSGAPEELLAKTAPWKTLWMSS